MPAGERGGAGALEDLGTFFRLMKEQRRREHEALLEDCKSAWRAEGKIGSIELLRKIGYSSPEAFEEILSEHPARAQHQGVDNIDRAFSVLRLSRDAIHDVYGAFHAQAVHDASRPDLKGTLAAATKEVFAFSFAASALIAAYRRITSAAPQIAEPLDRLRKEIFSYEPLNEFIKKLRNNFGHSTIFAAQPQYTITIAEQRSVVTTLQFDRKALLKGGWNDLALTFINGAESLDVMQIVSSYFNCAENLHRRYLSETGLEHDARFKDYLRLKEARTAVSLEVTLGLILQNAVKNGANPYTHLSRFLSPDELVRVRCFDDHSQAQVDYIIRLRDPIGLCSDDLRLNLYRLFGAQPGSEC